MGITGVSHVMLGTTDMTRALAFYRDTLGLGVTAESPEFTFLDTGAATVCLSAAHAKLGPAPGAVEVVLAVPSVRQAHADLTGRGVTFNNEPVNVTGESWAASFRDPDGHLLSIFGPE